MKEKLDDQTIQTYSVSLFFDEEVSQKFFHIQALFAEESGNSYLIDNSVPAHITLGLFHVNTKDLPLLKDLFSDFAGSLPKGLSLSFSGIDNFMGKVIFLNPDEESAVVLRKMNRALHKKISATFEAGGNHNYLPENFYPHLGLAVKLSSAQFEKARNIQPDLPGLAQVKGLSLSLCHPYCEISRVHF